MPVIGQTSPKGFVFGDAFYFAPNPWLDTTLGAEFIRRGSSERGGFRARPFENTSIQYTYLGVVDRGILEPGATARALSKQGGHQQRLEIQSLFPMGGASSPTSTSFLRSPSGLRLLTPSARPSPPKSAAPLS